MTFGIHPKVSLKKRESIRSLGGTNYHFKWGGGEYYNSIVLNQAIYSHRDDHGWL